MITSSGLDPAIIDAAGESEGILVRNCSGVHISNISIMADGRDGKQKNSDPATKSKMRCGIRIEATVPGNYSDIEVSNVDIMDIFYEDKGFVRDPKEVRSANGTQTYGWGVRVITSSENCVISGIKINGCKISNVSHTGLKMTGKYGTIKDIEVSDNTVTNTGGPGIQMSGVKDVYIHHNKVDHSGCPDDGRKWGRGSGFWCWGASDILIEYNSFTNANGPADSAGAHIDFNCRDVVLQYNFSANNAGGFIEILGNNHNCSYRYNISVDDGWRVKGENKAFQEGKTLWLSGFVGKDNERNGPYNSYIYNNTIYVSEEVQSKIAFENTLAGALVVNNIFYIKGDAQIVQGDQYRPEVEGESVIDNLVIKNNLFLHADIFPNEYKDLSPIIGDPGFSEPGGLTPESYIPSDKTLISSGIPIERLNGDTKGLSYGLEVSKDFFGNPIETPIIGAINAR